LKKKKYSFLYDVIIFLKGVVFIFLPVLSSVAWVLKGTALRSDSKNDNFFDKEKPKKRKPFHKAGWKGCQGF